MRRSTTNTSSTIAFCNGMLQVLYALSPHKPYIKQVRSLYSLFALFNANYQFSTTTCLAYPSFPSSSTTPNNNIQIDLSSICCSGITQSVISRCSHFSEKNKGKGFANASLKDLLLEISDIVPEYTRRLRRVSEVKPEDVLGLLLGFQFQCGKVGFEASKVESLWEIFKRLNGQSKGFKHLSQSSEVIASMLVRVRLLREVEFLLSTMESQGILLDSHEVFSNLIEGCVDAGESEMAMSMYDRMRHRLPPS